MTNPAAKLACGQLCSKFLKGQLLEHLDN